MYNETKVIEAFNLKTLSQNIEKYLRPQPRSNEDLLIKSLIVAHNQITESKAEFYSANKTNFQLQTYFNEYVCSLEMVIKIDKEWQHSIPIHFQES